VSRASPRPPSERRPWSSCVARADSRP
jgi:hypothetical protein